MREKDDFRFRDDLCFSGTDGEEGDVGSNGNEKGEPPAGNVRME